MSVQDFDTFLMETPMLTIEGKEYAFVKTRNHMPISIYKGEDSYVRIGPKDLIQQEINYHRNLLKFGFPIPEILSEGEYLNSYYFTESSFGDEHLGQIFRSNCTNSIVSNNDFSKLLNVVKIFAQAQMRTVGTQPFTFTDFRELIKVDILLKELPSLNQGTIDAVARVEEHVKKLPSVLTHGDFNPYNIFEKGVIDWERGSYAPMGYDLVTNISQTFFFPLGGDYEFTAGCRYSERQIDTYWREMDTICAVSGIPSISDYRNEFILCRSIWSVVRMDRWPKIQKWRYEQYEVLLKTYLSGGDLTRSLLEYR
jgi:hypothetical protein